MKSGLRFPFEVRPYGEIPSPEKTAVYKAASHKYPALMYLLYIPFPSPPSSSYQGDHLISLQLDLDRQIRPAVHAP